MRLGIIGSGPAGFYAAARVLQKSSDARVDMFEKLPVPFGLVRYGVAPDHPEVKNCQDRFEEVATSNRFTFIGNVSVGHDIPLSVLRPHYDVLLFAYGASQDRLLGIPGEQLGGVYSAREFVGWYNGLPEFSDLQVSLGSSENSVIIGNGNVALDVARILLSDIDALRKTDISHRALECLSQSRVKRVTVVGRRGPMQAAFTIKEVRELTNLPHTAFVVDEYEQLLPTSDFVSKLPRLEQRKYRLSRLLADSCAKGLKIRDDAAIEKECQMLFLSSPEAFEANETAGNLSHVRFKRNDFIDQSSIFDPTARVHHTETSLDSFTLPSKIAFRSIGYKSVSLPGLTQDLNVGFDSSRGMIVNDGFGRCLSPRASENLTAERFGENVIPGCYCTGWVKNGPTGVIASTMEDALLTGDTILGDWEASGGKGMLNSRQGINTSGEGWQTVERSTCLGKVQTVSWEGWKAIDSEERKRGRSQGTERVKIAEVPAMLDLVSSVETSKQL